jgi:hypothetical protein
MKTHTKVLAIGAAALLAGGLGWTAVAGTITAPGSAGSSMHMPYPGGMGSMGGMMGTDTGMMGGGMMGSGMMTEDFADPSATLPTIKKELAISEAQGPAWDAYATALKNSVASFSTMGKTAVASGMYADTTGQRAMDQFCHQHLQAAQALKSAAEKLVATLDEAQKEKAQKILPGFAFGGQLMMGQMMDMMGANAPR